MDDSARIAMHDFAGHPFQLQLSRELARRGHQVVHYYCSSNLTPHADLRVRPGEGNLRIVGVETRQPFEKYRLGKRLVQELELGVRMASLLRRQRPDVVVSSNVPVFTHLATIEWGASRARCVFWAQDLQSGLAQRLTSEGGLPARLAGQVVERAERRLCRRSDHVVTITDDFAGQLRSWGVPSAAASVVENWAPLDEVPVLPKRNPWSERHGLADCTVVLYAGTLGTKHNPELLAALAERLRGREDARVVVVSEGQGADWLAEQKAARGLDNLMLLPFQPFSELPQVLAAGDVLTCLLEPSAGHFSVPSKILSYHCAARPILASLPPENLAARLLERNGSGIGVPAGDVDGFVDAGVALLEDATLRETLGRRARSYADEAFDIGVIADRFEAIFFGMAEPAHAPRGVGPDPATSVGRVGV